ncbi:MAG: FAD-dependent oxidoreductase [Actinomycetales bacterium]|nr:FAD-dependent oxidoreductase [Actinomycetales bacterium]
MAADGTPGPVDDHPVRSVVVVGAGLAGARTVQALRAAGFTGRLTLLGAEGLEPYDRPPLSKELLSREDPAWLRDELDVDLAGVDVRLAEPATGLHHDAVGVTVRTAAGRYGADAVVLATGASPVRPAGWDGALTLHTAADAAALRGAVGPGRRLVIVGAGWIGAEVAGVAAAAGTDVTVVEAGPAPLATALGARVGALTAPWYARAGVRLLTGTTVRQVRPGGVVLSDTELPADAVLVAVGVRPASGWLGGALPLAADGSVEVDAGMRVPGTHGRVLAVGDLAARASRRHGRVPGGHWDGALREPEIAAASLLGRHGPDGPADPAPYLWSDQLGHALSAYGLPRAEDDVVLRGDPHGAFTAVWFEPGGTTVHAVLAVDRPRDVAAARRLFAGPDLPRLDRAVLAEDRPLR